VSDIRRGASGAFHDKGLAGASHHAIIPNANTVDDLKAIWPRLTGDERRLFDVVARSYLAAMMPDHRYRQTTATLDVHGHAFRATGRQTVELGWRAAFPDWRPAEEKGEGAQPLPTLRHGEAARLGDAEVEETRRPGRRRATTKARWSRRCRVLGGSWTTRRCASACGRPRASARRRRGPRSSAA